MWRFYRWASEIMKIFYMFMSLSNYEDFTDLSLKIMTVLQTCDLEFMKVLQTWSQELIKGLQVWDKESVKVSQI